MPDANSAASPVSGLGRIRQEISNPISIIGLALAVVAFGNIVFLFFIDLTSAQPSPYVGILVYMVAPAFLFIGLLSTFFGAFYTRRRRLASAGTAPYLRLDFSDPTQRGAMAFFLAFVVV